MGSSHDRCTLHPQRRLVGICALCLRERLTCLIESISPVDAIDGEDADEERQIRSIETGQEQKPPPPPPMHPYTHEKSSKSLHSTIKASAEMGLHSHANLEDSLNLAFQKVKHAHQLSFVAQSPYQGAIKVAPTGSPLFSSVANDKRGSLPASCRRSNASESDMKAFPGGVGKKKGSWFSISKAKDSVISSPLPQGAGGKLDDKHLSQRSPQVMIFAGRKSASDAIGGSCNNYRQAYMADLEAIAEINIGEAAIKAQRNEGSTDAHANSSWISSLFHRRRGSRVKSDVRHHIGDNNTVFDGKVPSFLPSESNHQSPKVSIDAGRLSLDGARPNFKQILKKIEARSKNHRVDCSPLQITEHVQKQYNDNPEDKLTQASALSKCKSVASARSSVSMDPQMKHFALASPSPMLHNNANTGMEYDNGDGDRSRSWGRAWNRTLSPLLGFRNHGRRSVHDPPHQHPGYATPDHVIFKNSIGVSPSSSSYLSPLRRSRPAPDAHIQFAQ